MKNLILESLQACISFGVKKFDFKYGMLVREFCVLCLPKIGFNYLT